MTESRGVIHDLTLDSDDPLKGYLADPFTPFVERDPIRDDVEVAIIGAGIGGVVTGAKLREAGVDDVRADRQGRRHRRHVVLEPVPGRDVRRRVVHLHADARGDGLRPHHTLRVRRGDPPAPRLDRREVRPQGRRAVPHRRREERVGRGRGALDPPHRPRRRDPRAVARGRARHPQPGEDPGDPGHGGLRGQGVPLGPLGLGVHGRPPRRQQGEHDQPRRQGGGGGRHRRERGADPAAARRVGEARVRVPADAVGHRRARQPPHARRVRARASSRAGSAPAWRTSPR